MDKCDFVHEYEKLENKNKERSDLMKIKNAIDNFDIKDWDKSKKMANPYELIYMPSKRYVMRVLPILTH